ncbi:MAG: Sfum_1244 family protein [Arenicellales bacterium]
MREFLSFDVVMQTIRRPVNIPNLVETVQHNCDVADARFAGDDTLCIYLLKMREYYRWVNELHCGEVIDREKLGNWIMQKEAAWDDKEEQDYHPLILGDQQFDRFDNKQINNILNPLGMIYSGGLGRRNRPIFFLGNLDAVEEAANCRVLICGRELARSMAAPPAMSHAGFIYVRRDALRRYLAALVEEWKWARRDNAMADVMKYYGFDTAPDDALDTMVDREQENLILHEIGERIAEEMIGEGWQLAVGEIDNPIQELKMRAVRDNLADCVTSLPAFLTLSDQVSLDFYYANMTPLRREMFPSFCEAYQTAKRRGGYQALSRVVAQGRHHWLKMSQVLVSHRECEAKKPSSVELESVDQLLERCVF